MAGGTREAAARRFVKERAGKEALFVLYFDEFDKNQPGFKSRDYMERLKGGKVTHGSLTLWANGYSCRTISGTSGMGSFSLANVPTDPRRRDLVLGLLDACAGETFRASGLDHLEFHVEPVRDGQAAPPPWESAAAGLPSSREATLAPGVRHVCYFRVTGP